LNQDTVLKTHRDIFYEALLHQDWASLAELYADDYILVRSTGTALTKEDVLTDLRTGDLDFKSIELMNEHDRLVGSVAILTGDSRTIAKRDGIASESHFRLVAVYVETEEKLRLLTFRAQTFHRPRTSGQHSSALAELREIP
jgi:hypothetical protein